ncbi:uncharacterized protein MYCFIDRAFT_182968 [Pseudocercospora fijiensis CIRAD86]|uniref:Ecp2 effector protein domain-containing protein n=1 Tax=Pseudocercospora fijiensis (strain CIRAD86) TaxID=383855 RepID=M3AWQ3_PSEFD|nr:uncharacterized protein MYCFIDRAFT_182968 [Pseudocercospora fijiensis CIRAD86]EME81892.1 hypothetical protein MYCFIDRAFT_182968 [Pseudocercospora fijiensis CIRAD86]
MKNLAVLVALLGGIAAMPTIDLVSLVLSPHWPSADTCQSNSIAFPNKILQAGNITCTQDEIPIEIDTAADVATHFNQFCHSTKFPASLARGASLMESYEIGIAGKFAFFGGKSCFESLVWRELKLCSRKSLVRRFIRDYLGVLLIHIRRHNNHVPEG